MSRLTEALKWFFSILFGNGLQELESLRGREGQSAEAVGVPVTPASEIPVDEYRQEGARICLAVLQEEARLVDFLMEDIGSFQDAQIGAAVRQVHDKASRVLKEGFGMTPLRSEVEGDLVTIGLHERPECNLVGEVGGGDSLSGTLRHHGWKTTQTLSLPRVAAAHAHVIGKAEVEVSA